MKHFEAYRDYYWDNGLPVGKDRCDDRTISPYYKIVRDPYRQRFSVERYIEGNFESVVYDSALFDFRFLKPAAQVGWQKETIEEKDNSVVCLIRSIEDRVILRELYQFDGTLCLECKAYSPHGILVSVQKMSYVARGDSFDGVTLYDTNEHPITRKKYTTDDEGQFAELVEQQWKI